MTLILHPSSRLYLDEGGEGGWVTINGVHVFIKGGVITKGPKRLLGKTSAEAKAHRQSAKAKLASKSAVPIKKEVQRYSEEHNEPVLAQSLKNSRAGINAVSLRDNEAVDVISTSEGKITGGTELKTMVSNTNDKITMSKSAIAKKQNWIKANHAPIHTVVYDDRAVYNAGGEGVHGDVANRKIYYKRGGGSFRTSSMHEVGSEKELRSLHMMKDSELPAAAQATSHWTKATAKHIRSAA